MSTDEPATHSRTCSQQVLPIFGCLDSCASAFRSRRFNDKEAFCSYTLRSARCEKVQGYDQITSRDIVAPQLAGLRLNNELAFGGVWREQQLHRDLLRDEPANYRGTRG
jgi:hypothetical protein